VVIIIIVVVLMLWLGHTAPLLRSGNHVLWKGEDERHVSVVQSINPVNRTATIQFSDTGVIELVSVLELGCGCGCGCSCGCAIVVSVVPAQP
jgi:hypothetical protein